MLEVVTPDAPPDVMQELHFVAAESDVVDAFLLAGWRREVAAGDVARAREEVTALLGRMIAAGLPIKIEAGQRRFDPIQLRLICDLGLQGRDPFLHERVVLPKRANAERLAPRARRPGETAERFHDPRAVSVIVRRELYPKDRAPGSPFIASMSMPVEEDAQREIVITPDPSHGKVRVAGGALSVRVPVDADGAVRFGARVDCVAYQQTVAVDPSRLTAPEHDASLAPYLAHDEGLVRVTPKIEALAARLARANPWDTLHAFWDYFFDEHKIGGFYYHWLSTTDPLGSASEWVDCYLGSALLIAVARARGIPARMVHGANMWPGTDIGLHYWVEAYLPPYGWVPFDLHCWNLTPGHKEERRWSEFSFAHLPYQLAFARMPTPRFQLGVQLPPRWFALARIDGPGQLQTIYDLDTGAVVQRDYMEVSIGPPL
jgi:hypothetical protein